MDEKRGVIMHHDNTKVVSVGGVLLGGGNPVRIQSMTNTKTEDVKSTVEQIHRLEEAGCELVRCTVPTMQAAGGACADKKADKNSDYCRYTF